MYLEDAVWRQSCFDQDTSPGVDSFVSKRMQSCLKAWTVLSPNVDNLVSNQSVDSPASTRTRFKAWTVLSQNTNSLSPSVDSLVSNQSGQSCFDKNASQSVEGFVSKRVQSCLKSKRVQSCFDQDTSQSVDGLVSKHEQSCLQPWTVLSQIKACFDENASQTWTVLSPNVDNLVSKHGQPCLQAWTVLSQIKARTVLLRRGHASRHRLRNGRGSPAAHFPVICRTSRQTYRSLSKKPITVFNSELVYNSNPQPTSVFSIVSASP